MIDSNLNSIESDSVNALANLAMWLLKVLMKLHQEGKLFCVISGRASNGSLIGSAIRQIIKQRDEIYKLAQTSKSKKDWNLFRQLRNKVVDECRKAKNNYLELRLDKNKRDPKRMWERSGRCWKVTLTVIYREIQCDDIMINDIYEMANIFNKYLGNSLFMTVEDDYAMELTMEKYTESQFEYLM